MAPEVSSDGWFIDVIKVLLRLAMKTYLTPIKEIEKNWLLVDADGKVLGRLATEIASRLRGKHKPTYCDVHGQW